MYNCHAARELLVHRTRRTHGVHGFLWSRKNFARITCRLSLILAESNVQRTSLSKSCAISVLRVFREQNPQKPQTSNV